MSGSPVQNTTRAPKTCHWSQFRCDDGSKCIPAMWQCDEDFDCPDKSDEKHCGKKFIICSVLHNHGTYSCQQLSKKANVGQSSTFFLIENRLHKNTILIFLCNWIYFTAYFLSLMFAYRGKKEIKSLMTFYKLYINKRNCFHTGLCQSNNSK